jgi:hypothetical protein
MPNGHHVRASSVSKMSVVGRKARNGLICSCAFFNLTLFPKREPERPNGKADPKSKLSFAAHRSRYLMEGRHFFALAPPLVADEVKRQRLALA